MLQQLRIACMTLLVLTVLTGGIYPMVVTVIARLAFSAQAGGSLVRVGERVVGSELIGQSFTRPEYFWGRLSATSPPYNAAASGGSNLGPLNPELKEAAQARIEALKQYNVPAKEVPVDLATASGSGLDPHISLAAAEYQVPRIALLRRIDEAAVRELIRQHTEPRQFGLLGEPRVNVLQLNLALDQSP